MSSLSKLNLNINKVKQNAVKFVQFISLKITWITENIDYQFLRISTLCYKQWLIHAIETDNFKFSKS